MIEPGELVERIWERDPTVWTGSDEAQWLGWLDEPLRMRERIPEIHAFAHDLPHEFDNFVLLGMGGSSLAPEVLRLAFGASRFHVLDTTHPQAIRRLAASLDLERTLFVAASKSGTTLETRSHLDFFWEKAGKDGRRFAAITDPGSALEQLAGERGFRAVFAGEPSIGGRYSALSPFGLVPAALMSVDLERLLDRAEETLERVSCVRGQPRSGARPRARARLAGRPRQGRLSGGERLRPLAGAAPRRVDREAGKGPRPGPGGEPGRRRPPGARDRDRRPVRPRRRVLPLGVRDRRRRRGARDQSLRPAERPGGEGPDARPARREGGRRGRARGLGRGAGRAGARRGTTSPSRPSSTPPRRRGSSRWSSASAPRPAASSRSASARATCTRPASCTRAAPRSGASSRSSTRPATSSRSPARSSGSGG